MKKEIAKQAVSTTLRRPAHMIGKLRGLVDESDADSVILDVGGVGYHVFCSTRTLMALPSKGQKAELIIETHVREDHIHLYGFANSAEREWFRILTSVQGVGVRVGLAILGVHDGDSLSRTIAAQDKTGLTRVSGVGPKLAERIVTELKSKVAKMGVLPMPASTGDTPAAAAKGKGKAKTTGAASQEARLMEDAVSALVNLGYNRTDAFTVIGKALHEYATNGEVVTLDALIRIGLKELAR